MEHTIGKHVVVKCSLEEGDLVTSDIHHSVKGKKLKVESVRYHPNCQTGFLVKVDGYEREVDSNWFDKIESGLAISSTTK